MLLIVGLCPLIFSGAALAQVPAQPVGARPVLGPLGSLDLVFLLLGALALWFLWARDVIGPGSMARGARRILAGVPSWGWLFAGGISFFAMQVGGGIGIGMAAALGLGPHAPAGDVLVTGGMYAAGLATAAAMAYLLAGRAPGAGLAVRWSDLPRGLIWLVVTLPIVLAIGTLASLAHVLVAGEAPDPVGHVLLRRLVEDPASPSVLAMVAMAVLAAPILEELMFRAFLQSALVRLTRRAWLGVLLTSLLFALMHLGSDVPWHGLPLLMVLGAAMGVAYERTARLGVPIVMHMLFNIANVALALTMVE